MNRTDPSKQPGVKIAQILLERAAFRHRDDYLIAKAPPPPDEMVGNINLQIESGLSEDEKTGLVRIRVQTIPEHRPFYEFDIAMAALVMVDPAAPNMPLARYFTTSGAALLYPFVRQVVADLTSRGRFGPVWLNPTNLTAFAPVVSAEPLRKTQPSPSRRGRDGARKAKTKKRGAARSR